MAGEVDDLLAGHRVLTGPAAQAAEYSERLTLVHARVAQAQAHLLIRDSEPGRLVAAGWESHPVSLEELVLAYLREPAAAALAGPAAAPRRRGAPAMRPRARRPGQPADP